MKYITSVTQSYDYIIVGSGSAGSVLAGRLAASGANRVLLVEAGGKDNFIGITMPAAMGLPLTSNRYNYKYFGEPENGGEKESIYSPRGRVLGGSSSINGMNWVRGNRADYDSWAELGLEGWDYKSVLPFFKKAESFEDGDSEYRGGSGPIKVERAKADNILFQSFFESAASMGAPLNADHNAEQQIGPHRIQRNIGDGRRMNASYTHIHKPNIGDNLHILLNTTVDRLIFDGDRCTAMEVRTKNRVGRVSVDGELILSTGAFITPKVLMLSGIGDANELKALGIASTAHLPAVGKNLSDHTCFSFEYDVKNPKESAASQLSIPGRLKLGVEWILSRKGLGATNHFEAGGFFSTDGNEAWPDMQMECIPMRSDFGVDSITVQPGFQCFVSMQRPTSTGSIWLRSANPLDTPAFRFNYVSTRDDQQLAINIVKHARAIMQETRIARHLKAEVSGLDDLNTDEQILKWAQQTAESNYHPCSTARMGTNEDSVVDANGKVHGLENLRVVDASIIPKIPSANLNAPTIMMAEKIAHHILNSAG